MKRPSQPWSVTPAEARAIQERLKPRVEAADRLPEVRLVAGVDAHYDASACTRSFEWIRNPGPMAREEAAESGALMRPARGDAGDVSDRALGRDHRGQLVRGFQHHPRRLAGDEAAGLGAHRQHRLGQRLCRLDPQGGHGIPGLVRTLWSKGDHLALRMRTYG